MKIKYLFFLLLMMSHFSFAQTCEEITTNYFEKIKNNPQKLSEFLKKMPKGGDLHNHHGGASYAENMMRYAKDDNLCIEPNNFNADTNPQCPFPNLLKNINDYPDLYNTVINQWSMRDFQAGKESGHDHFFATFGKYSPILVKHSAEILTEIVNRAGKQNAIYLELMVTPDNNASGMLGKHIGWDPNLKKLRNQLLQNGLKPIIKNISTAIDADEAWLKKTLYCGTASAQAGCNVKVRYLYQIFREQPPAQVFAQLLAGFEMASQDSRFVGINMVQPEDGKISMQDYKLHMHMVEFLHELYPHVHISLHAGELVPGLVSDAGLRFHIHDAVLTAHAKRIGHGVDIEHEDHFTELLKYMSKQGILVEINLISNAAILNVKGKNHPLLMYIHAAVPVALSTDDEGVLRTDLTQQYLTAVQSFHFSYPILKILARNSIAYSFVQGQNLWRDRDYHSFVSACVHDSVETDKLSTSCEHFLNHNEKAQLQWNLEKQFVQFEKKNS